jgi:hypothetical protein
MSSWKRIDSVSKNKFLSEQPTSSINVPVLGERNLIFSFTDFWGKILGRRREKNKNKKEAR